MFFVQRKKKTWFKRATKPPTTNGIGSSSQVGTKSISCRAPTEVQKHEPSCAKKKKRPPRLLELRMEKKMFHEMLRKQKKKGPKMEMEKKTR